jgi:hypothetical protein
MSFNHLFVAFAYLFIMLPPRYPQFLSTKNSAVFLGYLDIIRL